MADQERCLECGAETFTDHIGIVKHVAANGDILLEHSSLMYCHGRQSVQADDKTPIAKLECAIKTWLELCNKCDGKGWRITKQSGKEEQVECSFCCGSGYVHRGLPVQLQARNKCITELEKQVCYEQNRFEDQVANSSMQIDELQVTVVKSQAALRDLLAIFERESHYSHWKDHPRRYLWEKVVKWTRKAAEEGLK